MKFTLASVAVCAMLASANAAYLRDYSNSFGELQDGADSFEALQEATVTPGPHAHPSTAPKPSKEAARKAKKAQRKLKKINKQCG